MSKLFKDGMTESHYKYIGKGIYSIPEASRIIRVNYSTIKRWVSGYKYVYQNERRVGLPVFEPDFEPIDNSYAISFLDLIEIRFVNAFLQYGVSLRKIRVASAHAAEILEQAHPFTTKKFHTDKRTILMDIAEAEDDSQLLDLVKDQYSLRQVFAPYLYAGLELTDGGTRRWWPMAPNKSIVIDPARSFGQPILDIEGIPSATIANSYKAEGDAGFVARWFGISQQAVTSAIEYEHSLAA